MDEIIDSASKKEQDKIVRQCVKLFEQLIKQVKDSDRIIKRFKKSMNYDNKKHQKWLQNLIYSSIWIDIDKYESEIFNYFSSLKYELKKPLPDFQTVENFRCVIKRITQILKYLKKRPPVYKIFQTQNAVSSEAKRYCKSKTMLEYIMELHETLFLNERELLLVLYIIEEIEKIKNPLSFNEAEIIKQVIGNYREEYSNYKKDLDTILNGNVGTVDLFLQRETEGKMYLCPLKFFKKDRSNFRLFEIIQKYKNENTSLSKIDVRLIYHLLKNKNQDLESIIKGDYYLSSVENKGNKNRIKKRYKKVIDTLSSANFIHFSFPQEKFTLTL